MADDSVEETLRTLMFEDEIQGDLTIVGLFDWTPGPFPFANT